MKNKPWLSSYPAGIPADIDSGSITHVADLLGKSCCTYGGRVAFYSMGSKMSFRAFEDKATKLAGFMQKSLGIKKGDRVAVMLPNIFQFPVIFFAAQKIGAVCVHTNPMYTKREMQHQFVDAGVETLFVLDLFMDRVEAVKGSTRLKNIVVTSVADLLEPLSRLYYSLALRFTKKAPKHQLDTISFCSALRKGGVLDAPNIAPDDIALLQYTGGTTGLAKGAVLTHKNICSNVVQIQTWFGSTISDKNPETILTALPLYHIFALTINFINFFSAGHAQVLVAKPMPIKNTAKTFNKYKVTLVTGVNTLFKSLANSKLMKENPPKHLRFAVAGGMALQKKVVEDFQNVTGVKPIEGFGLTEASPVTHFNPMNGQDRVGSIGLPVPGTEIKLVDDEGNENSEKGEMLVRGPQVMQGYWQKDSDTSDCITNGWLRTGDIAQMDEDGFFYIVDRKKDMILVSGFNVYPNEIEEVLCSHPGVLEAAVIGIPDTKSGESVQAFVVKKDENLTADKLEDYCRDNLTGYKRPRKIEFKNSLPKSNVGKILRKDLRSQTKV